MGVVSRRWIWVESMGVASGCGCKKVPIDFLILSCVYTSQVLTRDRPSRDHGRGSDAGPAFTRIHA